MKYFLFFLLFAGFSFTAQADTLQLTGVGGTSSDGVYVYPYLFTTNVNSVTTQNVSLMCIDYNREITFGEQWNVTEVAIPSMPSADAQDLRALALLFYGIQQPGANAIESQFAAWSIFDPTGVAGKTGFDAAAQTLASNALTQASGNTVPAGFSYANFMLYTPTLDDPQDLTAGPPQRFLGLSTPEFRAHLQPSPSPTPEPSGLLLLGTGIFGVAGVMYRRVRGAVAGC